MRALSLIEFGRMSVVDLPPPVPAEDEALISIAVTGICGSDLHGFTGANGRRVPGQVMGHESVGTVAALGPSTAEAGFGVGHRVTFNPVVLPVSARAAYAGREQHCPDKYVIGVRPDVVAAFAEQIVVPIHNLVAFPAPAPIEHGALVEPLAVAVHAVRRAAARPGDPVVVIGGGPIGQSVVLALRMAGVTDVLVSEVDAKRRRLLDGLGALTVDPRKRPVREEAVRRFGSRPPLSVDAVGSSQSTRDALEATGPGGVVALVGMHSPRLELDAYAISTEERSVIGCFTYSAQDFVDAAAWIGGQSEIAARLISYEVSLNEAPDAFADLARGRVPVGKVLVRLGSPTSAPSASTGDDE